MTPAGPTKYFEVFALITHSPQRTRNNRQQQRFVTADAFDMEPLLTGGSDKLDKIAVGILNYGEEDAFRKALWQRYRSLGEWLYTHLL